MITLEKLLSELKAGSLSEIIAGNGVKVATLVEVPKIKIKVKVKGLLD